MTKEGVVSFSHMNSWIYDIFIKWKECSKSASMSSSKYKSFRLRIR